MASAVTHEDGARDPRTVEEIDTRLGEIQARMQEIDAQYAGQALPEAERAEFEGLQEEKHERARTRAELEERKSWIAELAKTPENREESSSGYQIHTRRPGVVTGDDIYDLSTIRSNAWSPEQAAGEMRDRALRAIERTRLPQERIDEGAVKGDVERLMTRTREEIPGTVARLILGTGSPAYRRAFGKMCLGQPLTSDEERAAFTLSSTGIPVVWSLDPTIIRTSSYVINPLRAISRIETIAGTNEWRGVTSGAVVATYDPEAQEAQDQTPTLTQPAVQVQRATTFVPFSREVAADWGAIETEMAGLFSESKDILEATQFLTGAGTTVFPQGVLTGLTTTQRVQTATTAVFVVGDLYNLQNALPPRARNGGATFLSSLTQLSRIRALDTSGGSSLWVQLGSGVPGQLLGMSAYELSTMSTAISTTTKIMLVGDFAQGYLIVDRVGMEIELIPHLMGATNRYPTGQRGLWAMWRNSAKVLDANRFRYLEVL